MMLDIDDFKFINDCYGHQADDKMLEQFGQGLAETRGNANFIGRYGGEEFLVVLPNTLPFLATVVAEHIRRAIAEKAFSLGEDTVNLTISIGIATTVTFRETCDELIACADRALYIAKLAGRDKAVSPMCCSSVSAIAAASPMSRTSTTEMPSLPIGAGLDPMVKSVLEHQLVLHEIS